MHDSWHLTYRSCWCWQVKSEADQKFWLKYTDVWVGEPSVEDDPYVTNKITPFQCRLRDCTYAAPIYVNVRWVLRC